VQGEFIRHDITETQPGVPVYLDEQFINSNSCEPITGLYADIWQYVILFFCSRYLTLIALLLVS
jgi:hypothetical protein